MPDNGNYAMAIYEYRNPDSTILLCAESIFISFLRMEIERTHGRIKAWQNVNKIFAKKQPEHLGCINILTAVTSSALEALDIIVKKHCEYYGINNFLRSFDEILAFIEQRSVKYNYLIPICEAARNLFAVLKEPPTPYPVQQYTMMLKASSSIIAYLAEVHQIYPPNSQKVNGLLYRLSHREVTEAWQHSIDCVQRHLWPKYPDPFNETCLTEPAANAVRSKRLKVNERPWQMFTSTDTTVATFKEQEVVYYYPA